MEIDPQLNVPEIIALFEQSRYYILYDIKLVSVGLHHGPGADPNCVVISHD